MAHDLLFQENAASMFYVQEVPWHELGTKLDAPATAEQAIKAARLDWEVRKVPLYAGEGEHYHLIPRRYAIVPSFAWGKPIGPFFGIVGAGYKPLQNREAFSFFDHIVGKQAAVYHTAGALGKGERVWILAKLPDSIRVVGDDITDKYLLLSNSHDGESAVQIKFTPIRVVCQNTLSMALARGPTLRVAHHRDVALRLKQAVSLLGIIKVQYSQIETSFKAMAGVPINGKRLAEYLRRVFPEPQPGAGAPGRYERAVMQIKQHREWATQLFEQGAGNRLKGVPGTLWAAYNGVTEMVDHHAAKSALERRLQDIWFGGGYSIKARAYNVAVEKIAAWKN